MSALDTLKKARELLADEQRWTKGAYARGENRRVLAPYDADSCEWCAYGAIRAVCGPSGAGVGSADRAVEHALESIKPELGVNVDLFNDDPSTTHADVLSLFDRAIAKLESSDV